MTCRVEVRESSAKSFEHPDVEPPVGERRTQPRAVWVEAESRDIVRGVGKVHRRDHGPWLKEAEMRIIGCVLRAKQQTIAMLDRDTGEFSERTLTHDGTIAT